MALAGEWEQLDRRSRLRRFWALSSVNLATAAITVWVYASLGLSPVGLVIGVGLYVPCIELMLFRLATHPETTHEVGDQRHGCPVHRGTRWVRGRRARLAGQVGAPSRCAHRDCRCPPSCL
jgi:hypothetical protein